jgi:hypothetical protein
LSIVKSPRVRAGATLAAGTLAAALLGACGPIDITAQRLEHSLAVVFPNYYVQQQARLGHQGVDPNALHPQLSCDKGGPNNPDKGAGNDWICNADWTDPVKNIHYTDLDPNTGSTRFEIKVNSDACYTAGGSSKVFGPQQLTDPNGKIFDNPMFEFDGCFNTDDNRTATTKGVLPEPAPTTTPTAAPSSAPSSPALSTPTATTTASPTGTPTGTWSPSPTAGATPETSTAPASTPHPTG